MSPFRNEPTRPMLHAPALQAPPGQPGGVAAPWMTGVAKPGLQSVQPSSANIRPMSMLTTAAKTNDKRGGCIVRANATQADPDGWQEWKNTFWLALFGVTGQGKIATTAAESTTPSDVHDDTDHSDDIDDIDDIDMVCFDCEDDDNDMTMACQ